MSTPEEAARRILNIDDGVSDEDHHEYLDAVAVARAYLELVQREREGGALPTAAPRVQDGETKAAITALENSVLEMEAYNDVPAARDDPVWRAIRARGADALIKVAAVAGEEQVRASARATPSPSAREADQRTETMRTMRARSLSSKREAQLLEALGKFLDKYAQCEQAIAEAFVFQASHGFFYTGPDYGEELKALRAALAAKEPQGDVSLPLSEGKPETLSDRLRRRAGGQGVEDGVATD